MTSEHLTHGVSFAELVETRTIVEPELAARAAVRKTKANLARLESALRALNVGLTAGSLKAAVDSERTFHKTLWDAAGDRVICRMLAPVHLAMGRLVETLWLLDDYKLSVSQHGSILVAVRSGNPDAASRAMTAHLETTATILARVLRVRSKSAEYEVASTSINREKYSVIAVMPGPSGGRRALTRSGGSELPSALACPPANPDTVRESRTERLARRLSGARSRQNPLENAGKG